MGGIQIDFEKLNLVSSCALSILLKIFEANKIMLETFF